MGSNENQVDVILNQIEKENSVDAVNQGLNILAKLVLNIIANPFDVKFRHVKTSNNTIKTKIMNLKHIQKLLEKLGYTRENQEMYTLRDEQLGDFLQGSPAIDYRRRLVSARLTSQAAYQKELLLISQHKAQQRQLAKKSQQTKRLKEKCQMDKLQRKHMKVDQTKSNQLKFGSKANTFKDIGIDLCAQKKGG